jgi:hypothetical protein
MPRATAFGPDLIVVLRGSHIAPEILAAIRDTTGAAMVNYATDDLFNRRIGTPELPRPIPQYDVYASTKRAIMSDVSRAGGRDVRHVRSGYNSSAHFFDPPATASERERVSADLTFAGEGDADRLPFLKR